MAISKKAIELLKHYESLHDGKLNEIGIQPKMDPLGIWTIGWGHAVTDPVTGEQLKGEANYEKAKRLYPGFNEQQAEDLMQRDLAAYEAAVKKVVTIPLNEDQFGAMVVFTFNVGIGALNKSTALRLLNQKDIQGAGEAMLAWNKGTVKGVRVVLKGLTYRRMSERDLLVSGELKFYN